MTTPVFTIPIQGFETEKKQLLLLAELNKIIGEHRYSVGAPVRIMQLTQDLVGYLPQTLLEIISKELNISLSELYSILTFYQYFTTVPKGKYVIQICKGTACYVKGGQKILSILKKNYNLEPGGITPDGKYSLEIVRCLGACGMAPSIAINEDLHGRVKASDLNDILAAYR
jgi:NADH:ubiquinone oxidoreductase subunit E